MNNKIISIFILLLLFSQSNTVFSQHAEYQPLRNFFNRADNYWFKSVNSTTSTGIPVSNNLSILNNVLEGGSVRSASNNIIYSASTINGVSVPVFSSLNNIVSASNILYTTGINFNSHNIYNASIIQAATIDFKKLDSFISITDSDLRLNSNLDIRLNPVGNAKILLTTMVEMDDFLGDKIRFYSHSYAIGVDNPKIFRLQSDRYLYLGSDTNTNSVIIDGDNGDITSERNIIGATINAVNQFGFTGDSLGTKIVLYDGGSDLYNLSISANDLDYYSDSNHKWHSDTNMDAMVLNADNGNLTIEGTFTGNLQISGSELDDLFSSIGVLERTGLSTYTVRGIEDGTINDLSTLLVTENAVYDFVIGLGYITDGNTGWDNIYGFITSAEDNQTLAEVLTQGNTASTNINMNEQQIDNLPSIEANDTMTLFINGDNDGLGKLSLFDYLTGVFDADSDEFDMFVNLDMNNNDILNTGGISFLTLGNSITENAPGNLVINLASGKELNISGFVTESLTLIDAGSIAATEQDWIEVQVGGFTGYIRVYATK